MIRDGLLIETVTITPFRPVLVAVGVAQETPLVVAFSTQKKSFTRFGREESETRFKDFSPAPYSFVCNWTVGSILINS